MADITQKLGFDTSQGVAALNNLTLATQALTSSLRALNKVSVGNVSKRLSGLNRVLSNTPKKANAAAIALGTLGAAAGVSKAQQSLGGLNNALGVTGNEAEKTGAKLRAAFASAFVGQKALSGLRQIKDLLFEAADASREFGRAVAEVTTVAGAGDTFAGLSSTIRELSNEFGNPAVEQAEAAYQAFSNQIVQSTGELQEFGVVANKLATGSVASVGDAVNILSSVLNSYGTEAGTATQISDVLFKTVEEGRLRISEIANTLGTVTPLAKEAGVSFTEITAALATITKRGTTASVAMTQVRGIVSKLLKPTELMNKAFKSFGATDGPSAIKAAGGLSNLLQKMKQFADENGTSLSKMFGRVRAGAGALNLTAEGGEDFNRILGELENSAGAAQTAFEKINGSDAKQAEIAFNKLKVTLSELGDAIVPIITEFAQFASKVIPDAQTLGIAIAGITAALGLVVVAATGAIIALLPAGALAGLLIPIAPLIGGIAVATVLLINALDEQNRAMQAQIDLQTAGSKAALANAKIATEAEQAKLKAIQESSAGTKALIQEVFASAIQSAAAANAKITSTFQGVLDVFVSKRKAVLKEIQGAISGADSAIEASGKRLLSIQQQIDDIKFDNGTKNLTEQAQVAAKLARALKTSAKSRKDLASAGLDQDKQRAALDGRAIADAQFAEAERAAAATTTKIDDKQVANAKLRRLKQLKGDEKKFSKTQKALQKQQEEAAASLTNELALQTKEIQLAGVELVKNLGTINNLASSAQEIADATAAAAKNLATIQRIGGSNPFKGLDKVAGQEGKAEESGKALLEGTAKVVFDTVQVNQALKDSIGPLAVDILPNLGAIEADQKLQVEAVVAQESFAKIQNDLTVASSEFQAQVVIGGDFSAFDRQLQGTISGLTGRITGAAAATADLLQDATKGIESFDKAQLGAAEEAIEKTQAQLNSAINTGKVTAAEGKAQQSQIDAAASLITQRADAIEARVAATKATEAAVNSKATESIRATERLTTAAGNASTEVKGIGTSATAASSAAVSANNNTTASLKLVTKAAKDAAAAQALVGGAGGGGAFFGKAIHRQAGGFTRGQDRILTSTAPGEFVMNAASTRQFRSELTAMNANQTPQFRETGGAVTNVGDINVNINSSDTSAVGGRSIARDLKRELRTRTSSL